MSTQALVAPPLDEEAIQTAPAGPPRATSPVIPMEPMPVVDPLLFVHAIAHHDLEQQRIASQNRLRILTTTEPDEDGVMRGFGLTSAHPDVARLEGLSDGLAELEHAAALGLAQALRRSAIHPWVKQTVGLGEKQTARLLAATGDPYWHLAEGRPRTVSELWAYCGLHVLPADHSTFGAHSGTVGGEQGGDPGHGSCDAHGVSAGVAPRRRRGQQANWSTDAKTRAYLCATSCMKQLRSPYRPVYLARRQRTADTHPEWSPLHSHNDALRIVAKAILRDLWREARRLHHAPEQHTSVSSTTNAAVKPEVSR